MVSGNHYARASAFREPSPAKRSQASASSAFEAQLFIVNSGYRTRYPLVQMATDHLRG